MKDVLDVEKLVFYVGLMFCLLYLICFMVQTLELDICMVIVNFRYLNGFKMVQTFE